MPYIKLVYIFAVFVATLAANLLATLEVIEISRLNKWSSTILAGVKATLTFLVLYFIVVDQARLYLAPAIILGEALANPIAINIRERIDSRERTNRHLASVYGRIHRQYVGGGPDASVERERPRGAGD